MLDDIIEIVIDFIADIVEAIFSIEGTRLSRISPIGATFAVRTGIVAIRASAFFSAAVGRTCVFHKTRAARAAAVCRRTVALAATFVTVLEAVVIVVAHKRLE